jgi:hypothetical protein
MLLTVNKWALDFWRSINRLEKRLVFEPHDFFLSFTVTDVDTVDSSNLPKCDILQTIRHGGERRLLICLAQARDGFSLPCTTHGFHLVSLFVVVPSRDYFLILQLLKLSHGGAAGNARASTALRLS